MWKKGVSLFLVLFFILVYSLVAETEVRVKDYFPTTLGAEYVYEQTMSGGTITRRVAVVEVQPDSEGLLVALESRIKMKDIILVSANVYVVTENAVRLGFSQSAFGNYRTYPDRPAMVMAPGSTWREIESETEYYDYTVNRSAVRVRERDFDDCLLVVKKVYLEGKLYTTEYAYYARGVGMVKSFTKKPDGATTSPIELINFTVGF